MAACIYGLWQLMGKTDCSSSQKWQREEGIYLITPQGMIYLREKKYGAMEKENLLLSFSEEQVKETIQFPGTEV